MIHVDILNIVIAVVAGLVLGWFLMRNNKTDLSKVHEIQLSDFKKNMRKGQLVDIRKKDAFNQNKIKGARNFTTRQLTSKYSKLRRDQSVFLYCQNGKKSKRIAKKLAKESYPDIYFLSGGFDSYK